MASADEHDDVRIGSRQSAAKRSEDRTLADSRLARQVHHDPATLLRQIEESKPGGRAPPPAQRPAPNQSRQQRWSSAGRVHQGAPESQRRWVAWSDPDSAIRAQLPENPSGISATCASTAGWKTVTETKCLWTVARQ